MTMTSDPAAPDAVAMLQRMHARAVYCANHGDVPRISSAEVLAVLRATEDERARHAEEVAEFEGRISRLADCARNVADDRDSLRDQLRRVEGELEKADTNLVIMARCAERYLAQLTARRAADADVRACAEYVVANSAPAAALSKEHQVFRETASRILAALDYHECPKCARSPATEALFAGSCEAEELRSGLEKLMADGDPRGADIVSRDSLQALLDKVDARDSLLTLETIDSLRDQLRKVTAELDGERERATKMEAELADRRAHDEDVRTCLEYCDEDDPTPGGIGGLARELLEWFSGRAA